MDRRVTDAGRLVMLPLATFLVGGNVLSLARAVRHASLGNTVSLLRPVSAALVVAFYVLVIVVYLRRSGATATTSSPAAKTAAVVASWLPLALPYAPGREASATVLVVASALMVGGMAWSVVALRTLGRSFSIVPQARAVVRTGPYAVVRHPLYLGELVAALGVVLRAPSSVGLGLWLLLLALQAYRTVHEERVLATALPDYGHYRAAIRWRIVPGLL